MPLEGAAGGLVEAKALQGGPKNQTKMGLWGDPINGLISRVTTPTSRGEITPCYPFLYFSGHL